MMATRTITIVMHDGNWFDVFEGEAYVDRLCWDEMLGEIAQLTHPSIGVSRYQMKTPDQRAEREALLAQVRAVRRWREDAGLEEPL